MVGLYESLKAMESDLQIRWEPATLRLQVEEKLRTAIASGRFRPGERLVERELCGLLGVGRTSVREAMRQLEAEGLIVNVPHRGPAVATIGVEEARQLYDVRALLEGFAGRMAATVATSEQVEQLRQAVDALEAAARDGGAGLIEAKTLFYRRLLDCCGNAVVRQLLTVLHNRVTLLRRTSMTHPGRLPRSLAEIREICERIAARDPDGAERACVNHIRNAAEVALAVLARQSENPQ